ncbi:MAG: RDD family protein [Akkermansiaceae bacterium]|nr:RDD family protein [Akkermansiaceae bacterium]MDP4647291.1 RDD family protein [Akkermansiaceae bacterium]MDP4721566.1 RDD family protein [Akkermansiaceae bacterium]MDP4781073.1 RDD family protein [Akkermansiaceae bacterium]MDP4847508.1 RDD family protein [Akkermansiaceae bacterium]
MVPAPLGKRFAAFAIDCVAFILIFWGFSHFIYAFGIQLPELVWFLAFPPLVAWIAWCIGNSPGKKFLGLYIVDARTGESPGYFQLFRRSLLFSMIIFLNILFIIPVLISKKRKALHDMLADTMVIEG